MKKAKLIVDQPMGIVISPGQATQTTPRVRAYFWCESELPSGADEAEK